jgi:heme/copper-type cytochrome/quinol oxidase subunit 2
MQTMKKYIIFFFLGALCALTSLFIPGFNIGMLFCFAAICFLFGRSMSLKEPKVHKKPHEAIDRSEKERADGSLVTIISALAVLIFWCVALKTSFFIWKVLAKGDYEQPLYAIATIIIMIAPCIVGYYSTKIIKKLKSVNVQMRID